MNNQEVVLCSLQETPELEEGMIFVRITDIIIRMLKVPLLAIGIILAVVLPVQHSSGTLKTLDLIVYPDGTTHVSQQSTADTQDPELTVSLFGKTIDNFVAQDQDGLLLTYEINSNTAKIQTFGASSVSIEYDSYDLVSKEGKIWTFKIDSPIDYALTMPEDTVIVGMTNFPDLVETIDNKPHLSLSNGSNEINYFFGVSGPAQSASESIAKSKTLIEQLNNNGIETPLAKAKLDQAAAAFDNKKYSDAGKLALDSEQIAIQEQKASQAAIISTNGTLDILSKNVVGIATSVAAVGGAITTIALIVKRTKHAVKNTIKPILSGKETNAEPEDELADAESEQDMREDDKKLVEFLAQNGGQAFEKDLRKKFLLPRTTMWRAVKRLERQDIIVIEKKDFQNLVKLKKRGDI
ncbi:MAG TPA: hypothetical protein VIG05_09985 [Candidatus Nitrosotenuis sp.]